MGCLWCMMDNLLSSSLFPRLLWKRLHRCLPFESVWKWGSVSQEAQLLPWIHLWLWRQPLRTVLPTQVHPHRRRHTHLYCRWASQSVCHDAAPMFPVCLSRCTHWAVGLVHVCRIDHQCPRGWWGSPTCGPCDCDTDKGFDPNCNKTSGHCHCKVSCKRTNVLSFISLLLFLLTAPTLDVVSILPRNSCLYTCWFCMCTSMTANRE